MTSSAGWSAPWLNDTFRDGNPIASAINVALGRAVNVVLELKSTGRATAFVASFGGDELDEVRKLTVVLEATTEDVHDVSRLIRAWCEGEAEDAIERLIDRLFPS